MTVAATLATAPLIALHFERASLVGAARQRPRGSGGRAGDVARHARGRRRAGQRRRSRRRSSRSRAAARLPRVARPRRGRALPRRARVRLPGWRRDRAVRRCAARRWPPSAGAARAARRRGRCAARVAARRVVALVAVPPPALACIASRGRRAAGPARCAISFLDVGQGDATLHPGRRPAVLVDTGPPGGPSSALVRRAGVRRLDAARRHPRQADHEGGAAAVLARAAGRALVLDGRDGDGVDLDGAPRRRGGRGHARARPPRAPARSLRAGPSALRVLWPPPAPGARPARTRTTARSSLVADASRRFSLLLTADAESDVLGAARPRAGRRAQGRPPRQRRPGPAGAARAAAPARRRRSRSARHNTYGHPAPRRSRRWRRRRRVLRTDRDGTVRVELRRTGYPRASGRPMVDAYAAGRT